MTSREELLKQLEDYPLVQGQDLSGIDLSGVELKRKVFKNVTLLNASFQGADLTETVLTNAT